MIAWLDGNKTRFAEPEHNAPASFRLSLVLYLRIRFQLSLGCEILGPEEERL